jgi:ABC-type branched-subunit amino acid transport system substrate-binding protein
MKMARSRKRLGVVVAITAAALVTTLVAPEAGAATQYPAVDQPGVTPKEIKVGGVVTASNDPTGGKLDSAYDGVKAYFDMVNASGGVYGRKLVLDSKRDDGLANNRSEVQGLLTNDDVFAVLPVAVQLFTGSKLLADAKVPTYGWYINPEWGSEHSRPGPQNFFTQIGDFHCFTCAAASPQTWLPKQLGKHRIGTVAFNVTQSSDCATGIENSFKKYPTAKVVFVDKSLTFGSPDYSAQVAQMKDKNVDMVITCVDGNGAASLAREMKKQGLNATLVMPNSYNADLVKKNAQVLNGAYTFTTYAPFEAKPQSTGMKSYMKWMKKSGGTKNENSLVGWINADELVTGLEAAGPNFTRQKVVDATNAITNYTAGGIVAPVNWTVAHEKDIECYAIEKVVKGKFTPVFGKKGKPFVCFPSTLKTMPKMPRVSA